MCNTIKTKRLSHSNSADLWISARSDALQSVDCHINIKKTLQCNYEIFVLWCTSTVIKSTRVERSLNLVIYMYVLVIIYLPIWTFSGSTFISPYTSLILYTCLVSSNSISTKSLHDVYCTEQDKPFSVAIFYKNNLRIC